MTHRYSTAGFSLILALLVAFALACDKEEAPEPKPWTFASEKAPYSVTMPPDWGVEDASQFNSFADFAARKGQLHLIVIPQRLPRLAGAAPPDALALKRAAVSVMAESIDELEVIKQGPIRVSGLDGHTVFATGMVKGQPHFYITTYVTSDDWGFQIIAWAPADRRRGLTVEVDGLLDDWTFEGDKGESKPVSDESDTTTTGSDDAGR